MESIEKERSELTLPLASSSSNGIVSNGDGFNVTNHTLSTCRYRGEIMKFKKTMVLPGMILQLKVASFYFLCSYR